MNHEQIGELFQELTKYTPDHIPAGRMPSEEPAAFKEYPAADAVIPLATVGPTSSSTSGEGAGASPLPARYADGAIPYATLEALLWAAQGVTARAFGYILRTAPSAGALYPSVPLRPPCRAAQPAGSYHLNIPRWALERIRTGDAGRLLAHAALDQGAGEPGRRSPSSGRRWSPAPPGVRPAGVPPASTSTRGTSPKTSPWRPRRWAWAAAPSRALRREVNKLLGVDGREETALYMTTAGPAIK